MNVFIGEYSVGKSNIIEAIYWLLGPVFPTFNRQQCKITILEKYKMKYLSLYILMIQVNYALLKNGRVMAVRKNMAYHVTIVT